MLLSCRKKWHIRLLAQQGDTLIQELHQQIQPFLSTPRSQCIKQAFDKIFMAPGLLTQKHYPIISVLVCEVLFSHLTGEGQREEFHQQLWWEENGALRSHSTHAVHPGPSHCRLLYNDPGLWELLPLFQMAKGPAHKLTTELSKSKTEIVLAQDVVLLQSVKTGVKYGSHLFAV